MTRRRTATVLGLFLLALGPAASAATASSPILAPTFTPPRTLADHAGDPSVDVAPDGTSAVAWQAHDPGTGNSSIGFALLRPDGSTRSTQTLVTAGPGSGVFPPRVVVDDEGRATVVWVQFDGTLSRRTIRAVQVSPEGEPGPVHDLLRRIDPYAAYVDGLDVDGAGRVTVMQGRENRIDAVQIASSGTPEDPIRVTRAPHARNGRAPWRLFGPQLAVSRHGLATVVWNRARTGGNEYAIRGALILPGGDVERGLSIVAPSKGPSVIGRVAAHPSLQSFFVAWTRHDLIGATRFNGHGKVLWTRTLRGRPSNPPKIEVDADGNSLILWRGIAGHRTQRVKLARLDEDGAKTGRTVVGEVGDTDVNVGPWLDVAADGTGIVAWRNSMREIQTRVFTDTFELGPLNPIRPSAAADPAPLAVGAGGHVAVVWTESRFEYPETVYSVHYSSTRITTP